MPRARVTLARRGAVVSLPLTLAKWRENLLRPAVKRQSDAPAGGSAERARCTSAPWLDDGIDDDQRFPASDVTPGLTRLECLQRAIRATSPPVRSIRTDAR